MGIAEDKLEILDLISRFSHAFDGGDAGAFTAVFTEDGVFSERMGGQEFVRGRGREELKAFATHELEQRGSNQPRHHVRNTVFIEQTADRAVTRTYFLATNVSGDGKLATVTGTGIYEDESVRTAEGWRIRNRVAIHDKSTPNA
jgi:hypothetical protein